MNQQKRASLIQKMAVKPKSVLSAQMQDVALTMALPREYSAIRLPTRPASYTAILESMGTKLITVSDTSLRRICAVRDPVYPIWADQYVTNSAVYYQTKSSSTWTISPGAGTIVLTSPAWEGVYGDNVFVDGAAGTVDDVAVLFSQSGNFGMYVPQQATFCIDITGWNVNITGTINVDITWLFKGEWVKTTVRMLVDPGANPPALASQSMGFRGLAGSSTVTLGVIIEAPSGATVVPYGWCYINNIRIGDTNMSVSSASPILRFGWTCGGPLGAPTAGPIRALLPIITSPEFQQSLLPYSRTRVTASSLLATNVTAELYKEGTVKAARLASANADFANFTEQNLDAIHPSLKYIGKLSEGVYTFTLPMPNCDLFNDCWCLMTNNGARNGTSFPLAQVGCYDMYNAMVVTDIGSGSSATQLMLTSNQHIEFESTSSLFQLDLSRVPLQVLQGAEVALLKFGLFHENWGHVKDIVPKVVSAVKWAAPYILPPMARVGLDLLDVGVKQLTKYLTAPKSPEAIANRVDQPSSTRIVVRPPTAKRTKAKAKQRK